LRYGSKPCRTHHHFDAHQTGRVRGRCGPAWIQHRLIVARENPSCEAAPLTVLVRGIFGAEHQGFFDIISITLLPARKIMADIVLRNLDDATKEKLRLRAAGNQRSMNAELLEIVSNALAHPQRKGRGDLKKLAADIRALSAGRRQTPSEDLLRESRDER
jgi:antitoxin FitA